MFLSALAVAGDPGWLMRAVIGHGRLFRIVRAITRPFPLRHRQRGPDRAAPPAGHPGPNELGCPRPDAPDHAGGRAIMWMRCCRPCRSSPACPAWCRCSTCSCTRPCPRCPAPSSRSPMPPCSTTTRRRRACGAYPDRRPADRRPDHEDRVGHVAVGDITVLFCIWQGDEERDEQGFPTRPTSGTGSSGSSPPRTAPGPPLPRTTRSLEITEEPIAR